MLAEYIKVWLVNDSGAQIDFSTDSANNTVKLFAQPWKPDGNGGITFGSEFELFTNPATDLADGAALADASPWQNTGSWHGLHCRSMAELDNNSAGTLRFLYEHSTDGGTTYPSDSADFDKDDLPQIHSMQVAATLDEHRGRPFSL